MATEDEDEVDTLRTTASAIGTATASGSLWSYGKIVLTNGKTLKSQPLPALGRLTIGRGSGVDVAIETPDVSRVHATLHLSSVVELEDTGSANGTRVNGWLVPPGRRTVIGPTDLVELGGWMLLIQGRARAAGTTQSRRTATLVNGMTGQGHPVIVADAAMANIHRMIERVAPGQISVMLLGETGVGKEVLAESLHRNSMRARRPLVRLNCSALSESLLESELFGYERGAFTGATQAKVGLLESADGGTVFLDEVGDMPLAAQVKLLRVLEDRTVTRVGGLQARSIDVRFVSATHRDLEARIADGMFREDLYFRLSGIVLEIPPLRERVAEIEGLAGAFLATFAQREGRECPRLASAALAQLESYEWPGNIRELRNAMERALALCSGGEVLPVHLALGRRATRAPTDPVVVPAERVRHVDEPVVGAAAVATDLDAPPRHSAPPMAPLTRAQESPPVRSQSPESTALDLKRAVGDLERQRILDALQRCGGNQSRAARELGISRRMLINRLDAYGVARPRKVSDDTTE